jgi:putative DNA primase/helicase
VNTSAKPSALLEAALAYARRGWRVHPLKKLDKTPISKNGCKDATLDEQQIRKWWTTFPDANIGLATGYEFFVIDIDPDGLAWYEANDLPATNESVTGRNGRHLLYKMASTSISNSASLLSRGVDVRGVGGYIVAPPSQTMICTGCGQTPDKHKTGCEKPGNKASQYHWIDCDGDVPEVECSDAPPWLLDACVKLSAPAEGKPKFTLPERIMHPVQHHTLFKYACSIRSSTMKTEDEIYELVWKAAQTCEEIPPDSHVRKIVAGACKYPAGLSGEYAERAMNKFLKTIKGDYVSQSSPHTTQSDDPHADATENEEDDDGSADPKLHPNKLAEKILKEFGIINVATNLYEYSDNYWQMINKSRLRALAMEFDSQAWTSQKRRGEVASYIEDITHRSTQEWRKLHQWEVPVANGVVDIRSMSLRPHRSEDYLQACSPVPFYSDALTSELPRCLDTYFRGDPDRDMKIDAIQEYFGYCLMPHARYKKALLCVGESDCGKSMISKIIRMLVGEKNTCSVSVEDMDDPRKRAPLLGKLVNLLTELTSSAMIADGGFKTLVSTEEPILFDPKNITPIMDVPICKHVIITNTLPTINDRSMGTYNRLLIIRFNYIIPIERQDRDLEDKLQRELPGILLWALEGAQRLFHNRGVFTAAGTDEVKQYRRQQDPISGFIADMCIVHADHKCHLPDLRDAFTKWLGKTEDPRKFADKIRAHGFVVTDNPQWIGSFKKRVVEGLSIRQPDVRGELGEMEE